MSRTKLKTKKPVRLADYPKPYRDALACFEAFRRCGFSADEIYFGFGPVDDQPDIVHMQLQTQGKTFTVTIAQLLGQPYKRVVKTWRAISGLMNLQPPDEPEWREHVWLQSKFGADVDYFANFATAIRQKGIIVPELVAFENAGSA